MPKHFVKVDVREFAIDSEIAPDREGFIEERLVYLCQSFVKKDDYFMKLWNNV